MNDMKLIETLQAKVAALESETGKLREALRLEKQRSEEWKKQAMRLAEEKENAVGRSEERKRDSVEGST